MSEAIVITPVKNSPHTTLKTIEAICHSGCEIDYYVFNDFSEKPTKELLEKTREKLNFNLIHLEDVTTNPSPNYKLVLQMAQEKALKKNLPLIIIESDVIIKHDTITELLKINETSKNPGLVGAITVDKKGHYNFPYNFEKKKSDEIVNTSHSLSFCCTLLSVPFLSSFSFTELSQKKDWFDVSISRQSKKMGFNNYLAKGVRVLHLPHSSRPWKNLKYSNPFLYYFKKITQKRDRI
ncbi:MAG: glycosyltransferase family A protein [Bacteroidota bacterium]